jgi:predicted AlkP superfamily phosphohydrolase/phosphomutase
MKKNNKVLILGLDGATWDVLDPWISNGTLPNLGRLRKRGSWGVLSSTIPPVSAPAWSSFMTGKRPGKHGVFHFIDLFGRDGAMDGRPEIINARSLKSSTLWDIMGHHDRAVASINVPMTYPPRPVNGLMITGLLTPRNASNFTYPPELSNELTDYIIDLDRFIDTKPAQDTHDLETVAPTLTMVQEFRDMLEKRAEAGFSLMDSRPWDIFTLVFTGTDRMGHYLWHYHRSPDANDPPEIQALCSAVQNYYARLDEILGEFIAKAGEGVTTIVMSDHGMGPNNTKLMHWNTWMNQKGWTSASSDTARLSDPDSWFRRLGLPRDKIGRLVRRIPGLAKRRLVKKVKDKSSTGVDENQSQAYCVPIFRTFAGVRINLEGEQKEALQQEIVEELKNIFDPDTGETVVQQVYLGEDYYNGPYAENIPDIIICMKPDYGCSYRLSHYSSVITEIQTYRGRGNHHSEGIFIASGPDILTNPEPLTGMNIEDIAPTALYLMDLPVPSDMDGHVLNGIFDPAFLESQPVTLGEPLGLWPSEEGAAFSDEISSDEDEEQIRERLRGLGYLD